MGGGYVPSCSALRSKLRVICELKQLLWISFPLRKVTDSVYNASNYREGWGVGRVPISLLLLKENMTSISHVPMPSCDFNVMREKLERPARFYDVMMMCWTQCGTWFIISTYSPMQQNHLALHWDRRCTQSTRTQMTHTFRHHGESFVLSQLFKEVYGIRMLVVLFLHLCTLALWTRATNRRLCHIHG